MRPESGDFQEYSGTVFANEAEVECARLLDYYGIAWEYEPTSFPLETDEEGRVVEAFTPDFFLPEQELYLEVTVMKQSLVTRKNRKIRKFRERYPDIKVKLFTRRDFERLGQKYGLNLVTQSLGPARSTSPARRSRRVWASWAPRSRATMPPATSCS